MSFPLRSFFYFQDESFLEDINMILNTADIPNLYEHEDKLSIIEKVFTSCLETPQCGIYIYQCPLCREWPRVTSCMILLQTVEPNAIFCSAGVLPVLCVTSCIHRVCCLSLLIYGTETKCALLLSNVCSFFCGFVG